MKKILIILCVFSIFILCSCGQTLPYSEVFRDKDLTGGSLTFVYDSETHTAIFGGQDEVIQFYKSDVTKGWDKEGCRVGIEINAPENVKDFDSGTISIDGEKILSGQFYHTVNENKVGKIILTPLVSEEKRNVEIKIEWTEGGPVQIYHIKIDENTKFMSK